MKKLIKTALISVYHKTEEFEALVRALHKNNIQIISTGGTADHIKKMNIPVTEVEEITGSPEMFGGRVKTLHPNIFGAILYQRGNAKDEEQKIKYQIREIDLVVIDLYPFEETVKKGGSDDEIIDKIDVGGPSMIRAAAKNHKSVVVIPSKDHYATLVDILHKGASTTFEERRALARNAFMVTCEYDSVIYHNL